MDRRPEDFDPEQLPEDFQPGKKDEGFGGHRPEDFTLPQGETLPADFDPNAFGGGKDGMQPPEGFAGETPPMPQDRPGSMGAAPGEASAEFYLTDKVNAFSGIAGV